MAMYGHGHAIQLLTSQSTAAPPLPLALCYYTSHFQMTCVTMHEKTDHSPQIKIFKIWPYEDSLFLAGHADSFRFSIGLSVAKL